MYIYIFTPYINCFKLPFPFPPKKKKHLHTFAFPFDPVASATDRHVNDPQLDLGPRNCSFPATLFQLSNTGTAWNGKNTTRKQSCFIQKDKLEQFKNSVRQK